MMSRFVVVWIVFFLSCRAMTALELHFNNVGEAISKKDSLTMVRVVNHALEFYGNFKVFDVVRLKLRIFSHPADMLAYFREQNLAVDNYVGGLYSHRLQEAIVIKKEGRDYKKVVFHEFAHHLTFLCLRNAPRWLNEGLSEYFEQVEVRRNKIVHLLDDYSVGQIKTAFQLDEINLADFMAWGGKAFYKHSWTNQALPYTLAHCMVYFLIEQKPETLKQIVKALQGGDSSKSAVEKSYAGGMEGFVADFRNYIMKLDI